MHQPTQPQCDTMNMSSKKIMDYPGDNKELVSILAPTDGGGNQTSVISHINSRHQHSTQAYSSTIPSKTANLRCNQNDDGGSSDSSTVQKSVHFEKLPYIEKVNL